MHAPASIWREKKRSLDRAARAFRLDPHANAEDLRRVLDAIEAIARAAKRQRLAKKARRLARPAARLSELATARRVLVRAREVGLLSLEVAAALEERWEEAARAETRRAADAIGGRRMRRLRRRLSDLGSRKQRTLARRLEQAAGLAGGDAPAPKKPTGPIGPRLRREGRRAERARHVLEAVRDLGDASAAPPLERETRIAEAISRWRSAVRLRATLERERRDAEKRGAVRLAAAVERLRRTLEASVAERRRAAESVLADVAGNVVAFSRRTA